MKNRGTLGLIWAFMNAYRWRTAVMLACLVLSGFAEGVGVMTMLPVIEAMNETPGSVSSPIGIAVQDALVVIGVTPSIGSLLVLLSIAMVVKAALLLVAMLQAGYTVAQVTTDLRTRVIKTVLAAEWRYFVDNPIGMVSNSIATESQRASKAYYAACLMMAESVQVIVYAGIALSISPLVTMISIALAPLIFLLFAPLVRSAKHAGNKQTELQRSILEWVTHGLQGIKPIKAMGRVSFVGPVLERDVQSLNSALRKQTFAVQALKTQQEPVIIVGLAAGLYAMVTIGGMQFSSLLVLAILFYRLIGKFAGMQKRYQTLVINHSAYWSLDSLAAEAEARKECAGGSVRVELNSGIEFDNVIMDFGEHRVLNELSLTLPKQGLVVLTGPSGAGKTTLIDLLTGLIQPIGGEIRIDGVSLDKVDLAQWRHTIGYVPQEMVLFHDSIRNNVLLGDEGFTDKDIWKVIDQAGLLDVIKALPEGLDTMLGEQGARLSGGQRQRLAIARALIRRPRILILDEVTTSLDPATERTVCNMLNVVAVNTLVLAISHQQEIQRVADQIINLENGSVVQCSAVQPVSMDE